MTRWRHNDYCRGFSLVEAMMAVFLLTILAIAGASYLYHSGAQINHQRTRRAALEVLNGRIEALRATPYAQVTNGLPLPQDVSIHYVSQAGTNWIYSTSDPEETVIINGLELPISTTVQLVDLPDSKPNHFDYLKIVARAGYRLGSDDRITLESYYAPQSF